jgi:hypothetical protein
MARVRRLLFGAFLIIPLTSALVAQSDSIQSDINAVRATYAKLVFASRLSDLRENVLARQALPSQRLEIVLSDFKTGSVSDLKPVPIADLLTKPSGNTLAVTPGSWAFKTIDGQELRAEYATLAWRSSDHPTPDWNLPFARLFDIGAIDPGYIRYVSYTAKVSYSGQQRQYQSLFLFGHDAKNEPMILPLDKIVDGGLLSLIEAPPTPDPLLAEPFRDQPETKSFLESLRATPGCSIEHRTGMCCDDASGRCGVTVETLKEHGFAAPE